MIALLRKSGVALFVLALALIAQIPHAAHVFDRAPYIGATVQHDSAWYAWMLAYAYAIALESATLMFVIHGHKNASYGFALASFAVNLSYYAMHGVYLWVFGAFPAWLLSALLPISIASYSHILTGAKDAPVHVPAWAMRAWAKMQGVMHADAPVTVAASAQPEDVQHDATRCNTDATPSDAKTEALQMHSNQMPPAEIARILQQKESTVRSWIRRSNGATKVSAA
jgi:hypothetical protein